MNYERPESRGLQLVAQIQRQLQALNKLMSHVANAIQTLRKHILISQEHLSQDVKTVGAAVGKGIETLHDRHDDMSDQIAEGHQLMATKDDMSEVKTMLKRVINQQSYLLDARGIDPEAI